VSLDNMAGLQPGMLMLARPCEVSANHLVLISEPMPVMIIIALLIMILIGLMFFDWIHRCSALRGWWMQVSPQL
jgi:hypothetical protein